MRRRSFSELLLVAVSAEACLSALKAKVDAGADFVITQFDFDADTILKFISSARAAGISVPIIPGILPLYSTDCLRRLVEHAGIQLPRALLEKVEDCEAQQLTAPQGCSSVRDDFQEFGIQYTASLCQRLLPLGVPGVHFYTLNLAHIVHKVLKSLGLSCETRAKRALPWRPSHSVGREREAVRCVVARLACARRRRGPRAWCAERARHVLTVVQAHQLGQPAEELHLPHRGVGEVPGAAVGRLRVDVL